MGSSIRKTFIAAVSVFAVFSFQGSAVERSVSEAVPSFESKTMMAQEEKLCPAFPRCK